MNSRMKIAGASCCVASLTLSGCATLLDSGPSLLQVAVASPTSSVVTRVQELPYGGIVAEGGRTVRTELNRQQDYRVVVNSPGYDAQVVDIRKNVSSYFWGNVALAAAGVLAGVFFNANAHAGGGEAALLPIVFVSYPAVGLGVLGAATDFWMGTMWRHSPTDVKVNLQPSS